MHYLWKDSIKSIPILLFFKFFEVESYIFYMYLFIMIYYKVQTLIEFDFFHVLLSPKSIGCVHLGWQSCIIWASILISRLKNQLVSPFKS